MSREIKLFGADKPCCLLIQPSARHENATLEAETARLEALSGIPFLLAAIELEDWTRDLLPWPDRNISRDEEAGKHAEDTLRYILSELIPDLEERYGHLPVIIGGYSLGGLFALWASTRTERFEAVAAASPSVWIRDWLRFAGKNPSRARRIYLSLGDREEKAKNQAIARVGDNLRTYYDMLKEQMEPEHCTLVWEEGGHFAENDSRLARAFAWCLKDVGPY